MALYEELQIDQASTFEYTVTLSNPNGTGFDLTSYTATGRLKRSYSSSTAVDFNISYSTPATDGKVRLYLSDETTAAMKAGHYVWDVVIENASGEKFRVIEGIAEVNPGVTL